MDWNSILLVCAALLPAIALCIYVFIKDRVEKEPIGLLLGLFFLGVAICFPAAELEEVVISIIDSIFSNLSTAEVDGTLYLTSTAYKLYYAVKCIFGVALIEEGLKFLVMFFVTRKSKHFNSLFDGIVYAVFVSLGFAALENVLYVLSNGWMNALMRAVLSVPGHMFFAVIMGYYYSMWHMHKQARDIERDFMNKGFISTRSDAFTSGGFLASGIIIPILAHGLYNYCCGVGSVLALLMLIALVVFLYVFCFKRINKMSKEDMNDATYSMALVFIKYPHLAELLRRSEEKKQAAPENSET